MNGHRLFNFTPLAPIYEGSFEGHHSGNVMSSSNLFPFNSFRTLMRDRNALNSFRFMHLRTTFIATEGWGARSQTTSHSPLLTLVCFQQVTTVKLNYPMRIVHPERTGAPGEPGFGSLGWGSEGSLCEPEADTTKTFVLLSFQRVTSIKFCNPSVLITIQNARGRVGPPSIHRNQQLTNCSTSRRHGRRRKEERRTESSGQRTLHTMKHAYSRTRVALTKNKGAGRMENASFGWLRSEPTFFTRARVAELADALASGASDRKVVEVRVLSRAPNTSIRSTRLLAFRREIRYRVSARHLKATFRGRHGSAFPVAGFSGGAPALFFSCWRASQ
jgi:hypothetical protein